jgi:hypothetical protein
VTDRELMQQALEALIKAHPYSNSNKDLDGHSEAITALRQAIEQAEQMQQKQCLMGGQCKHGSWCSDVYCQEHCKFIEQAQQTEQAQPLTDEELWKFWWSRPEVPDGEDDSMEAEFVAAVRRVLAAHGIGKGEA